MHKDFFWQSTPFLNLVNSLVILLEPDGTVKFINQKGCQLLAASRAMTIGTNWIDRFGADESKQIFQKHFKEIIQGREGQIHRFEGSIVNEVGEVRPLLWICTALCDDQGNRTGIICFGEDIYEKQALLQQLARQENENKIQLVTAVLEAQERERYKLGQELHDNVNQMLVTCKLLLEEVPNREIPVTLVQKTTAYLGQAIDEIRSLSHRLVSPKMEAKDLEPSIMDIIGKLNAIGKFQVNCSIKGHRYFSQIPPQVILTIFRIIQEQLNNIAKHAEAQLVYINLEVGQQTIDLEIRDDGKGFDDTKESEGLGLKSMYNRVRLQNGYMYIHTAPNKGCTLSIYLPY